jgi:hydrogenase large subunit
MSRNVSRRVVGPFNRVEGDLEVKLDIAAGEVREARVVAPLYRGFEQMLVGRDPRDALVYTPRICGICSVAQSVATARALAALEGIAPPDNGRLSTNLVLANENVADHLTHFYLFFMPDFAHDAYRGEPWFGIAGERFKAARGTAAAEVLLARAEFLHLMGLLAGKWPHSLAIQPGGTTRAIEPQERIRIGALLHAFRRFLERTLFGDELEAIVEIGSADALMRWYGSGDPARSDFTRFLHIAEALQLERLGRAGDLFMSYGAYDEVDERLFRAGVWQGGERMPLRPETIHEDLAHSWMGFRSSPKHPYEGVTVPAVPTEEGYSWCKAPRLGGRVVEVGALARQLIDGHPLALDLVARGGGNVRSRVIARLLELARVTIAMERWARELVPGEPFCNHGALPEEGQGMGLIEAARGSLGHWIGVRNGRIHNYQIIAPTTWNFSPRDSNGVPGALEQALVGAPVHEGEQNPLAVQHIVRSFDPCMACTVH